METANIETTNLDPIVHPSTEYSGMIEAAIPRSQTSCPTCGSGQQNSPTQNPSPGVQNPATGRNYIYAIGKIESRFPSISVEKEFAQVLAGLDTKGKTDREAYYMVLSNPHNLYLARQLCWVMNISGVDTYILVPRNPADLSLLIESLRPAPDPGSLDAVIGVKGPIAPNDMCNGLTLPIVFFDHMYSFDRESLLKSIPAPKHSGKEFAAIAAEVLDRILASTDNAGATEPNRALNYLALRDPGIYALTADCFAREFSLTAIEVRPWRLSVTRKVAEVIFTFTQRKNEFVEKYSTRVDVNDLYPFLSAKIAPYYDH
jgi:hypothetical protein